jgi:hypothetical protein
MSVALTLLAQAAEEVEKLGPYGRELAARLDLIAGAVEGLAPKVFYEDLVHWAGRHGGRVEMKGMQGNTLHAVITNYQGREVSVTGQDGAWGATISGLRNTPKAPQLSQLSQLLQQIDRFLAGEFAR